MTCAAGASPFDFLTCFPSKIIARGNCQTHSRPRLHGSLRETAAASEPEWGGPSN